MEEVIAIFEGLFADYKICKETRSSGEWLPLDDEDRNSSTVFVQDGDVEVEYFVYCNEDGRDRPYWQNRGRTRSLDELKANFSNFGYDEKLAEIYKIKG